MIVMPHFYGLSANRDIRYPVPNDGLPTSAADNRLTPHLDAIRCPDLPSRRWP